MARGKRIHYYTTDEYRGEPVAEDPELTPCEKETVIAFTKGQDEAIISSWEAAIIRRLLSLDHFRPTRLLLRDGAIVYAEGILPLGAIKILAVPRASSSHAEVVARARPREAQGEETGVAPGSGDKKSPPSQEPSVPYLPPAVVPGKTPLASRTGGAP